VGKPKGSKNYTSIEEELFLNEIMYGNGTVNQKIHSIHHQVEKRPLHVIARKYREMVLQFEKSIIDSGGTVVRH
jgi:hypothetical protein